VVLYGLETNFIKICPEIALKYFFEKMWFYMKYIVKIEGDEYLCPWTVINIFIMEHSLSSTGRLTSCAPLSPIEEHD
jgi:hypothetical protein